MSFKIKLYPVTHKRFFRSDITTGVNLSSQQPTDIDNSLFYALWETSKYLQVFKD